MRMSFTEVLMLASYIMIPIMFTVSLILADLTWLMYSLANCGFSICIHGIKEEFNKEK